MHKAGRVRLAVVGTGAIGSAHARDVATLQNAELIAVCDNGAGRAQALGAELGCRSCDDYRRLLDDPALEAVIVATPHFSHPEIAMAALKRGIHVLVEKPIAVHVNDALRMIRAYEDARAARPDLVFAAMFMQRAYGQWVTVKALISGGELGQLQRITWIITDWFRTQAYYDAGTWRATWRGEGGGVLLNQAPHQLDLYQWLVGMPARITGIVSLGKYHTIEVEDEVSAFFEHDNGLIGHFIASTAESPGTNRLEIVGEYGRLVFEDGRLHFTRNADSVFKHIREATEWFARVDCAQSEVPYTRSEGPGHRAVIQNFLEAIQGGAALIAPAPEGLNSVMLSNAILLSSMRRQPVELPLDGDAYERLLQQLIDTSGVRPA